MQVLKIITLSILLQACNNEATNRNIDEREEGDLIDEIAQSEFLLSDSISLLSWTENKFDKILTVKKVDRILLKDTFSSGLGFNEIDFDYDGFNDLIVVEIGGNHGTYYLYLWDESWNSYRQIENYKVCPHSRALKPRSNLFYNVDLAGCYGNHKSILYKLEGFKILPIAYLYIQDCASDESPEDHFMEIRISTRLYSIENGRLIERIENIPYGTYEEIIENYWLANFEKLIK